MSTVVKELNYIWISFQEQSQLKLREYEQRIQEQKEEIIQINDKVKLKHEELEKIMRREKKYKHLLNLKPEATSMEVEERIDELKNNCKRNELDLEKIQKELSNTVHNRDTLQLRLNTLGKDKEKIEFHMRQQELTMRKMKRLKTGSNTLNRANALLANRATPTHNDGHLRLPTIGREGSQIKLGSELSKDKKYCVFCHMEVVPMSSSQCRIHHRPIRNKQWECCKDPCNYGAGCLVVPHFYIEVNFEKKAYLTDGLRYLEVSS